MTAQIVDGPGYVPDGCGGITLLGEWGRNATIKCGYCGLSKQFRLCADEILTDIVCDRLLDEHLRHLGWSVMGMPSFDDVCPTCTQEHKAGAP